MVRSKIDGKIIYMDPKNTIRNNLKRRTKIVEIISKIRK